MTPPVPLLSLSCIGFEKRGCVVALHSELFNMMSPGEIQFIMGHEIGHFLLNHNFHKKYEVIDVYFKEDLEQMMKLMKINNINV